MKKLIYILAFLVILLSVALIMFFTNMEVLLNQYFGLNLSYYDYLSTFVVIWTCLFLILSKRLMGKSLTDSFGSSRWLRNSELKKLRHLDSGGVILGMTNDAKYKANGTKWIMKKEGSLIFNDEPEHVLIIAPTRKGKGINCVIPTLLSWTGSVICYDIKKENYDVTSGWRRKFSHVIRFEPTSMDSARFNPLMEIEKGINEISQVQNLVDILTNPFGESKKDHWVINASQLLLGVILHVLYVSPDKTLSAVYGFINDPEKNIMDKLQEMLDTKHINGKTVHQAIAQAARNMLNKGENELSSIISTASSFLTLYQDPIVKRNTSASDFTVRQLQFAEYPTSLFLVINPADADRLTPLTRLVIQMAGTKLTKELHGDKHKLLFLIDEFPSLGNLEFFEKQLAFFAGYKIKCFLIIQSYSQLYKHYTRDTSIPDNSRYKVILGADNAEEAERISKFLGTETISRQSSSKGDSILTSQGGSISTSEAGRGLMLPDEILRMPFNEILILFGGTYPYKAAKIMYFLDRRFKNRANIATPETDETEAEEFIPIEDDCWTTDKSPEPEESEGAEAPDPELELELEKKKELNLAGLTEEELDEEELDADELMAEFEQEQEEQEEEAEETAEAEEEQEIQEELLAGHARVC